MELAFDRWLSHAAVPSWHREYRFEPARRWRLDFAWPEQKVGVEIDGLLWGRPGGHQTVSGILRDSEKHEALMVAGWRILRVPGPWVAEGQRMIWRTKTMDTLKLLLGIKSKGERT